MIVEPALAIAVRRAEERDVAGVSRIEATSFADPWSEEAFRASLTLEHMRFLVAEWTRQGGAGEQAGATGAGTVAGYVLAMTLGPEGEIADIAVAPEARGRGVGGVLLDEALADLRRTGVRTVYLEVRESNEPARRLYASRAFADMGRRKGYYQHPPEDALVLRRELK